MRKVVLIVFLIIVLCFSGFLVFKITEEKVKQDFTWSIPIPTSTPVPLKDRKHQIPVIERSNSIFVPYWSLKDPTNSSGQVIYDEYIYFGIAPDKNGINFKEQGAKELNSFLSSVPKDAKKLLAVRMIDSDTNFYILKNLSLQDTIINQSIAIAKENNFDGIVLDLEVSAIPFESLIKQITDFNLAFSKEVKKNDLKFAITIYGDVFYRVRPFDVKALAKNADEVMIMAYDFSKAKGNPGPNFPLYGTDTYGYDMAKMIADFTSLVPLNKITVVFGLFGYDWLVDSQDRTLSQAKSMSSKEIENKFIENCEARSCSFSRDSNSSETEIHYVAKDGTKHVIWFEDISSVQTKKDFLKTQGISSFSYWAHSYF